MVSRLPALLPSLEQGTWKPQVPRSASPDVAALLSHSCLGTGEHLAGSAATRTTLPAQMGSVLPGVCGALGKWRANCISLAIGCAKHWAPGKALYHSMGIQWSQEFHSKESQKIYFMPKGWCFQLIFFLSPHSQGLYYTPETSLLGTISDNGTFFKYHCFFLILPVQLQILTYWRGGSSVPLLCQSNLCFPELCSLPALTHHYFRKPSHS